MTEATLFLPGLSPVGGKTITATFDGGTLSSDGGVLILREVEKKLGLATVLSRHIPDDRDGTRITHSYSDMTRARMFAIASGHEDCDDLDVLRSDPALKMACGRLPVSGTDLMSQPTHMWQVPKEMGRRLSQEEAERLLAEFPTGIATVPAPARMRRPPQPHSWLGSVRTIFSPRHRSQAGQH